MTAYRLLLSLMLSIPLLLGTAPASDGVKIHSLQLSEIRSELGPFQDQERYDYVGDDYEYAVIDEPEFDRVFYQSALLAARFEQSLETTRRYRDDEYDLNSPQDNAFLHIMSAESDQALPTLLDEAETLIAQVGALNPRDVRMLKIRQAVRGVNRARKNLKSILDRRQDVDQVLDDYAALKADLETVEEPADTDDTSGS
jgi:hypothetical protein